MFARTWRGWTRAEDAERYAEYVLATGIDAYRRTPGNRGAFLLRRTEGERTEFLTLSFWESMEAIAEFAGADVERAVFYPDDDDYLVERELRVSHFEVVDPESSRS